MQQDPIVIEVTKQPTPTPEISYGSVLVSAVNMVMLVLGAAVLVGAIVGGVIILRKRRAERRGEVSGEPSHVRLRIQ